MRFKTSNSFLSLQEPRLFKHVIYRQIGFEHPSDGQNVMFLYDYVPKQNSLKMWKNKTTNCLAYITNVQYPTELFASPLLNAYTWIRRVTEKCKIKNKHKI